MTPPSGSVTKTSPCVSIEAERKRVLHFSRFTQIRPRSAAGLEPSPPPDRPDLLQPRVPQFLRSRPGAGPDQAPDPVARPSGVDRPHRRHRVAGDGAGTLPARDSPGGSLGRGLGGGARLSRGVLANAA